MRCRRPRGGGTGSCTEKRHRGNTGSGPPGSDPPGELPADHAQTLHDLHEVYLDMTVPSCSTVLCAAISALCTLNFSMLSSFLCPPWPKKLLRGWECVFESSETMPIVPVQVVDTNQCLSKERCTWAWNSMGRSEQPWQVVQEVQHVCQSGNLKLAKYNRTAWGSQTPVLEGSVFQ